MVRKAVDRDHDRADALILCALFEQIDDGRHGVVRVRKEHIVTEHRIDERGRHGELVGDGALEGRVFEGRALLGGEVIAQREEELIVEEPFVAETELGIEI